MKDLTLKLALEQTIEVWEYLSEHLEIRDKKQILVKYNYLRNYLCYCPLCEHFRTTNPNIETNYDCRDCPLNCNEVNSCYRIWDDPFGKFSLEERCNAAKEIVSRAKTRLETLTNTSK